MYILRRIFCHHSDYMIIFLTVHIVDCKIERKISHVLLLHDWWLETLWKWQFVLISNASLKSDTPVNLLKLVSAIFYQFFVFSSNDSPSKTMKRIFYFISKARFVLKILRFLYFFPFLSILSRYKRTNGRGIIYDVMNWLA